MLIYFKSRSKARNHAATLKANGIDAQVTEATPNPVTGSRYAVKLTKQAGNVVLPCICYMLTSSFALVATLVIVGA